jgi:hypothetical protein
VVLYYTIFPCSLRVILEHLHGLCPGFWRLLWSRPCRAVQQGPVVQSNPGLKFNLVFWFVYLFKSVHFQTSENKTSTDTDKISGKYFRVYKQSVTKFSLKFMNNGTRLKPVTNIWASIVSFSGRLHVASEMHSGISQPNRSTTNCSLFVQSNTRFWKVRYRGYTGCIKNWIDMNLLSISENSYPVFDVYSIFGYL